MRTLFLVLAVTAVVGGLSLVAAPSAGACPDHVSVGTVGYSSAYTYPRYTYPAAYSYPSYYTYPRTYRSPMYYTAPTTYHGSRYHYPSSGYYYPRSNWGPSFNIGIGRGY